VQIIGGPVAIALDISQALAELEDARLTQYAARLRSLASAGDEAGAVGLVRAILGEASAIGIVRAPPPRTKVQASPATGTSDPLPAAALERRFAEHANRTAAGMLGISNDVADLGYRVARVERLLRAQGHMIDFIAEDPSTDL
jgi:hypothetical protein